MQVSQNLTPPSSMRSCATISGCSAAFSATPCASRKGGGVRSGREHPADLDPLPPRRGQAARRELEAMLDSLSTGQTMRDHPRLQLFLAPRQHRRGSAPHPPHAQPMTLAGSAPRAGDAGPRARPRTRGRHQRPTELRAFFADALVSPGAHRPSDRSAAQKHA